MERLPLCLRTLLDSVRALDLMYSQSNSASLLSYFPNSESLLLLSCQSIVFGSLAEAMPSMDRLQDVYIRLDKVDNFNQESALLHLPAFCQATRHSVALNAAAVPSISHQVMIQFDALERRRVWPI